MNIVQSGTLRPARPDAKVAVLLELIEEGQLRKWVEHISVPRHFGAEPEANRATAAWLFEIFDSLGFGVERQGPFSNIVASPKAEVAEVLLVGAHYDSVPMCPGADDNGSAVAAMLGCATACARFRPNLPVVFVAFNREEEGLLGSRDFVETFLPTAPFRVRCAHVLEMVGYASPVPGTQQVPLGLPIKIRDTGDFLGLLANSHSNPVLESIVRLAGAYVADLPVTGLQVRLGMEKLIPVLARSDHVPFWAREIPAVMWTDTAEFRNTNYHRQTDTPETLDYQFLRQVTQLLTAAVIQHA